MDESATGSANFLARKPPAALRSDPCDVWWPRPSVPAAAGEMSGARPRRRDKIEPMHLRPPSVDHGIVSFIWAFALGLLLWLFMLGIGISKATSFIIAALVAFGIFLYVRLYGEDVPRRRSSR
jgi:hypothetical protein